MDETRDPVFSVLNAVDVSNKVKTKNNLSYLSWASAWAEVKKKYPDATYEIHPQVMDEVGNVRYWHDDGRTGWVEVEVTIENTSIIEVLAIMDYRNKAIAADEITSVDANKSIKRCLVKALALHGLGLYIYEGEDLPEEVTRSMELKASIKELASKKCGLSDRAKSKVMELCKAAEREANPDLDEELISGNYNNIEDSEILSNLQKQLLAVRK